MINLFKILQGVTLKGFTVDTSKWKLVNNLIVVILALWGIATHSYNLKSVSLFESFLIEAFAPIQRGTLSMKEKITYMFDHYLMIVNTSKQNEELNKKVETLENRIFQLNEVEKENMRLKQLLQFGADIPREKVLAQVVSWDSSNEFRVLRINKGRNHGLRNMSPVITMNGLVGYVYRLSANYADILTILDQNNRVDAIVARTRAHGIIEGIGEFKCRLKYVTRTEQVEVGDEIITAGLGNIYPKGIKIGSITKIDKENYGITQSIEIEPSVDFHKLEEVVVLIEREENMTPIASEKMISAEEELLNKKQEKKK
jgi:rod shape-determining protein MreC